jgi:two-component system, OmpR family, heavy metal sensor histidine kinase CusS
MTIRTRMTLWYAGILLVTATVVAGFSIQELRERHKQSREPDDDPWEDVVEIMLMIGIPAALLSIGGGWWLMRRAMAPITALTAAAERINEQNLGERLPGSGNGDELDRLTDVLNAMTARLHGSFTRIREFTLHASHELKTPLTVLCAETETELRDENITPAHRERAASQLDELRRLARIVDNLTLLAKADAGLVPLEFEPLHLDELVRDTFADVQILALAPGLRVELAGCETAMIRGDRHRLRQLLLNLADNALKYNQPQGSLTMALRRSGDQVEFQITNTGPGIDAERLPRVFDRFFRGDPSHSNNVEGCGLGLSIAQWIVAAHGGTIQIDSVPAKLTTVTVRLPLLPAESTSSAGTRPNLSNNP